MGLRLKGMQLHVQYWEEVLAVQSLALAPHENMNSWLKFSNLCRQTYKPKLAQTTLINLLTDELIGSFKEGSFKPSMLLTAKDAPREVRGLSAPATRAGPSVGTGGGGGGGALEAFGKSGFQLQVGVGGSIKPPNTGGGGGGERAQLTGPLISFYEFWRRRRPKFF